MTSVPQHVDAAFQVYSGDLPPAVADNLHATGRIAWDIETTGLDWKTDRIALCQMYAAGQPVAFVHMPTAKPRHLLSLLGDPTIVKIFHHAMFDVRFMSYAWNAVAANIACTKISAKILFTDQPDRQTLKSLAAEVLGVTLDKSAQRSDWTVPVHSPTQLRYASNDVVYLETLLDALIDRLRARGLSALAQKCFDHVPTRVALELGGFGDVFTY